MEYDVTPYEDGQNRGTERVVMTGNGRAFYTNDHYANFVEFTP